MIKGKIRVHLGRESGISGNFQSFQSDLNKDVHTYKFSASPPIFFPYKVRFHPSATTAKCCQKQNTFKEITTSQLKVFPNSSVCHSFFLCTFFSCQPCCPAFQHLLTISRGCKCGRDGWRERARKRSDVRDYNLGDE